MKKWIWRIFKLLGFTYLLGGALLYIFQRDLLYYPTPKIKHTYDEIVFENENEHINVIALNKGKQKAIIYFGGNGDAVGYNIFDFLNLHLDYTIYLVEYRGYGSSSGMPTQNAIFSDALYLYDEISKKHSQISLIGRSLGSGVATYLASKREIEKMVLVTPFDSAQSVAQELYPIYPMSILLKDKYLSSDYIKDTSAKKILMLMAQNDKVVTSNHSYNLLKDVDSAKYEIILIKNEGHNSILGSNAYYQALRRFFDTMAL